MLSFSNQTHEQRFHPNSQITPSTPPPTIPPEKTSRKMIGDKDGVLVYNTATGFILKEIKHSPVYSVAFSPNGRKIVVGGGGEICCC